MGPFAKPSTAPEKQNQIFVPSLSNVVRSLSANTYFIEVGCPKLLSLFPSRICFKMGLRQPFSVSVETTRLFPTQITAAAKSLKTFDFVLTIVPKTPFQRWRSSFYISALL